MYQHDEIGHQFIIQSPPDTTRVESILQAPPIILDPDFICRPFRKADGIIAHDPACRLVNIINNRSKSKGLISVSGADTNDIPALLNCATATKSFHSSVSPTSKEPLWKFYQCYLDARSLCLKFLSNFKSHVSLTIGDIAILQMRCGIIYTGESTQHTRSEHYDCVTDPCTAKHQMASFRVEYRGNTLLKPDQNPTREITVSQVQSTFADSYR